MSDTKIEWCDKVWNPVRGCSRVSAGCDHCYAIGQAHRFSGKGKPYEGLTRMTKRGVDWTSKVMLVHDVLEQPLHWKKPQRIFVNSMSDLFHENVPFEFIQAVYLVAAACSRGSELLRLNKNPMHTFIILTKRIERALEFYAEWKFPNGRTLQESTALSNVWIGPSIENQKSADERIPAILKMKAAARLLSVEPILDDICFHRWLTRRSDGKWMCCECCWKDGCENKQHRYRKECLICGGSGVRTAGINWVIVGGESGSKARPMEGDWARSIRDECHHVGVKFFMKRMSGRTKAEREAIPDDLMIREFPRCH